MFSISRSFPESCYSPILLKGRVHILSWELGWAFVPVPVNVAWCKRSYQFWWLPRMGLLGHSSLGAFDLGAFSHHVWRLATLSHHMDRKRCPDCRIHSSSLMLESSQPRCQKAEWKSPWDHPAPAAMWIKTGKTSSKNCQAELSQLLD